MIAIRIQSLTKSYGERLALCGIDLEVPKGQVLGYIGPNGAGKSTTVRILTGALLPSQGTVEVAGFDVVKQPLEVKRRIGYVPEVAALYESLSPAEYLAFVAGVHGLDEATAACRIAALLEVLGLTERLDTPMSGFSKGMRQRVAIAAALIHDPEVVILDEPLSGLDAHAAILLKEIVLRLSRTGRTIFYCSHQLDVVERVCHRVVILNRGRIEADGEPEELIRRSRESSLEAVFRELTSQADFAELAARFVAALSLAGERRLASGAPLTNEGKGS
ncbi:MAG: ABC transporter ATP-binding protein [Planctomycetota bacterium]